MHGNVVNPKYILFMSLKHLYECAKILACTEILSLAAETYSPCTETYSLCAEIFSSPRKFFWLCAEIIMSHARILGF